jgi:probable F420-dependent oxidoreductase
MKFGVIAPYANGLASSGTFLEEFIGVVEECGAESIWAVEHVVIAQEYDPKYPYSDNGKMFGEPGSVEMPDPLELLAFIAGISQRLILGTAMVIAPLHSPTVLAKRVATIDRLSGGRMEIGLGIGWQREEYAAVGASFERRGDQLTECIEAMRELWSAQPATYHGQYVNFDRVFMVPSPTLSKVPIVLGGHSDPAVKRAGTMADGWFPFTISPEEFVRQAALLRSAAEHAGRDGNAVAMTAWPGSFDPSTEEELSVVRAYVDAGASRLIVNPRITQAKDLPHVRDQLMRYAEQVAGVFS